MHITEYMRMWNSTAMNFASSLWDHLHAYILHVYAFHKSTIILFLWISNLERSSLDS